MRREGPPRWLLPLLLLGALAQLTACKEETRQPVGPAAPDLGPALDEGVDLGPAPQDLALPDLDPDACHPVQELCNGLDDDCDGMTDEDFLLERDVLNCGRCGNRCRFVNASSRCVVGACELGDCLPGYIDEDGRPENGCEAPCTPSNNGLEICDGRDNDCNGVVDDGFDTATDPQNCGSCARRCLPRHAVGGCEAGECLIASCEVGWFDANGLLDDGCEATCQPSNEGIEICDRLDNDCDGLVDEDYDLRSDVEHCGTCETVCAFDHASPRCLRGECVIGVCDQGWLDANHIADDGCEAECEYTNGGVEICDGQDNDCDGETDEGFDLELDVDNCGRCGRTCRAANAVPGCEAGDCVIASCQPGFVDADHRFNSGCETPCLPDEDPFELCDGRDNDCDGDVDEGWDLANDVFNCGGCGRACAFANATPLCEAGFCLLGPCQEGYANFDLRSDNGCEAQCVPSNGGVEICDGEDNDCNGVIDDDFALGVDPDNCGVCGRVCPDVERGERGCAAGECGIAACNPGWQDANGELGDGCEYPCVPDPEGIEVCDGRDNDCNGEVDDRLGPAPIHCRRQGVCRDAAPVCDPALGWICPYPDTFQEEERHCDDLDNDCDGQTDEGFDGKGVACAFGVGVCRGAGQMVCSADGQQLECSEREHLERVSEEICDGLDNDCDGLVDEGSDAMVTLGDLLVYRYEAARPDATAAFAGSSFARACSTPGRQPWTNVDYKFARLACSAAEGKFLCPLDAWQLACSGAAERPYPYGQSYDGEACNGYDWPAREPVAGGSMERCQSPEGVFDLSGNVWEWVDVDYGPGDDGEVLRGFIGGAYANVADGLRCDFGVAAHWSTARANIGFRCCSDAACADVECAEGHFCRAGQCHSLCEDVSCAAGMICELGFCRPLPPQ